MNIPLNRDEYDLYIKHLKTIPELLSSHESEYIDYNVQFNYHDYEKCLIVKVNFHDKINRSRNSIEYYIFKNRLVGDDFNDLSSELNEQISKRIDDINIDFITFEEFRLKLF